MTIKERKKTNRLRTVFSIVVAVVAAGLFLAGCGPGETAATATPGQSAQVAAATVSPTALSVLPTPAAAASAVSPVSTPASPVPTPDPEPEAEPPAAVPAIPTVAPDFTLQRSGGGTFTLSEQLSQGPVVLVFFQRGGG